ncbi:MAG: hypothetical protein Q9220_004271 [cf. Caloplaca sp. 1 TL-2023]
MALLVSLFALSLVVGAAPNIGLPINAQVPPVALVSEHFTYTFSESTFSSSAGNLAYALANAPGWLHLDRSSRTLSGDPGSIDAGSVNFNLIANDDTGSTTMPVTLVVSTNSGPRLGTPIAEQLSTHLGYESPTTILLPHSSALKLAFSSDTFADTGHDTIYYAMCANNTPLPSWITFDPEHLSFSGLAPQNTSPDELPQTFDIQLTASDVVGFSGALTSFRVTVETHLFVFDNQLHTVNVTQGSSFNFDKLKSSLSLDGRPVNPAQIRWAYPDMPGWVSFDESTFVLSGVPPNVVGPQNFSITAIDSYGENATTTVVLQLASKEAGTLYDMPIDSASATIGEDFDYRFNKSLLTTTNTKVAVDLGGTSPWLQFNQAELELSGHVPGDLKPQNIILNITLSEGSISESKPLNISVITATHSSNSRSTNSPASSIQSGSAVPSHTSESSSQSSDSGLPSKGHHTRLAVAIAVPATLLVLGLLMCCCFIHRRRRRRSEKGWLDASKRKISRPFSSYRIITRESPEEIVEKPAPVHKRASLKAPIFSLPTFRTSVASKRKSFFRLSKATTDGPSQAPKMDPWDEYIEGLSSGQSEKEAQQQFSLVLEEQAAMQPQETRSLRIRYPNRAWRPPSTIHTSPTKRTGQNKRRSDMSFGASSFLPSQRSSGFGHGRSLSSFETSYFGWNTNPRGHGDGGPRKMDLISRSWRDPTLNLSTPTDSTAKTSGSLTGNYDEINNAQIVGLSQRLFPRPQKPRTSDYFLQPPMLHETNNTDRVRQKTVRVVDQEPPNTYGLPLHAFHKRRARNRAHRSTFFGADPSTRTSSHIDRIGVARSPALSTKLSKASLASALSKPWLLDDPIPEDISRTHSHSSCWETPSDSSRPSPSKSRPSPHKRDSSVSVGSKGGGLAALISNTITQRFRQSRSSLVSDQRFTPAVSSELSLGRELGLEDRDAQGHRRWKYEGNPNPLGIRTSETESRGSPHTSKEQDSGHHRPENEGAASSAFASGGIASLVRSTDGMNRQLQRLNMLRQQGSAANGEQISGNEGSERRFMVGSTKGKRPVSVDNGLVARGSSMRGALVGEGGEEEDIAFI